MEAYYLLQNFLPILVYIGFIFLIWKGTFIKTKYFRYSKVFIGVVLIGALYKLMHWPYAIEIVGLGYLGIFYFYFMSFLKKPYKILLDYIKLVLGFCNLLFAFLRLMHVISLDFYLVIDILMFFAMFEYFKSSSLKKKSVS